MIVGRRRTDSVGVCHAGTSAIVAVSYSITCSITSSPSCVIHACVARRIHNFSETIMITLAKNYAHTHTVSLSLHYIQKSSNGVDRIAVGAPGTYLWRGTYIHVRIHLYTYVAIYIHCGLYTCLYLVLVANDYRCFDSDHTHRLRISTIPTL